QTGYACEIRTQAGIFPGAKIEQASDSRFSKISVNEHGAVAELRKSDSQIRCRGGFPFPRQSAGNQNHLRRMLRLRKKDGGTKDAKSFRHLRLRKMLGHQLDAFVVAILGKVRQHAAALVTVGARKLRNDREGRQPREG